MNENGEFNFEYVSGQNGSLELEFTDPNGLYESQKKRNIFNKKIR